MYFLYVFKNFLYDSNDIFLSKGHRDWIFSSVFVSETKLITGSRDSTIKIWSTGIDSMSINDENNIPAKKDCLVTRKEHTDRIRHVQFSSNLKILVTLAANNEVKIWDIANLDVVSISQKKVGNIRI